MISIIVIVLVAGTLYYLVKTANDFYQRDELENNKYKRVLDDTIPLSAGYILGSLNHSTNPEPINSSSIFKEVAESIVDSITSDSGSSAGGGSTSSWSDSSSDSGSDGD